MTFGTILRNERENKRLSQSALSEETGISQPTLSSWETDRTKPNIDELKRLSKALKIPAATFFEENPSVKMVQHNKDNKENSQQNIQYQCVISPTHEELIATQKKLIISLETQLQQALSEIERLIK